jgi:hypothetical protein
LEKRSWQQGNRRATASKVDDLFEIPDIQRGFIGGDVKSMLLYKFGNQ